MKLEVISTLSQFDDLRDRWREIYTQDTAATVFQSWGWLRGWIEAARAKWLVLAFRPTLEVGYVGFFALRIDPAKSRWGFSTSTRVRLAGDPFADYTGLICVPEYEDRFVALITEYLATELRWDRFALRDVSDARLFGVLEGLNSKKYIVRHLTDTPCPQVLLPDSWEAYLNGTVTPSFAKKLVYKTRKAEKRGLRFIKVGDEHSESGIDLFANLFFVRWGKEEVEKISVFRSVFRWAHHEKLLQLHALQNDGGVVAIQASFVNLKGSVFHFYNGGWDPAFAHLSPALVLHGHCIKNAIEQKYKVYDFMRGAEPYKYLYGAENLYNKNVVVMPATARARLRMLMNKARGIAGDVRTRIR